MFLVSYPQNFGIRLFFYVPTPTDSLYVSA